MKNTIEIKATRELEKSEIDQIKSKFDKNADVKVIIDQSLVGGVIIRYKDEYFDGSVKGQLGKLKQKLIS